MRAPNTDLAEERHNARGNSQLHIVGMQVSRGNRRSEPLLWSEAAHRRVPVGCIDTIAAAVSGTYQAVDENELYLGRGHAQNLLHGRCLDHVWFALKTPA